MRALASELRASLLVLDSSVLAPYVRYLPHILNILIPQFVLGSNVRPCRIVVKTVQRVRKRIIMQSQRMKVPNLRWMAKVMRNLVKAMMMIILLNLWQT